MLTIFNKIKSLVINIIIKTIIEILIIVRIFLIPFYSNEIVSELKIITIF